MLTWTINNVHCMRVIFAGIWKHSIAIVLYLAVIFYFLIKYLSTNIGELDYIDGVVPAKVADHTLDLGCHLLARVASVPSAWPSGNSCFVASNCLQLPNQHSHQTNHHSMANCFLLCAPPPWCLPECDLIRSVSISLFENVIVFLAQVI